ncbi:hypothetical protein T12_6243 [Trichinella patagoniensis]|uniref:Uncharacterized protein n=1 Tax=Trichinella patagoniensis TaxID=990121 RepID=A0A0V0ZS47_9BILA|nr:hypothetical protein T12_6243 [Trichinella patagoniensis]
MPLKYKRYKFKQNLNNSIGGSKAVDIPQLLFTLKNGNESLAAYERPICAPCLPTKIINNDCISAKHMRNDDNESNTARRELLLAYVRATYSMDIRKYVFPKETRECTYGEINDIFKLSYQPKVTVFTARMEFGKINTQYGETITKCISRLKEACAKCNLGVDPEYTSKTCRFTL